MAVYVSAATGNWTTMSTWQTVDATSYSGTLNILGFLPVSTGGSPDVGRGQPFTPGAITIDAIGVMLANRPSTTTSGTITVSLYNTTDNAEVAGTSVTINVTDVPVLSSNRIDGGWYIFKFSAPVTLTAGKAYSVVLTTTNTDNAITAWTIGDFVGNWSRLLRTTTNPGSLSAGDDFFVAGELTGAGTSNSYTVTMDNTSTTDFGNNLGDPNKPSLAICNKGTLSYGTAGSTNYYLKISNYVVVYNGGTFNIGTTGTPIPSSSTAVLEFDSIGADDTCGMDVKNGSTLTVQGSPRTAGKLVTWCLLTADAAAGATSLTVNQDTGWLDGDQIVVADTGDGYSAARNEKGVLNGNAGSSTLTVKGFAGSPDAGLVYDHLGTAPIHQAEVINLTRNVKIRSSSSTNMANILFKAGSIVDIDWAEIYYSGNVAAGDRGVVTVYAGADIASIPINVSIRYSSLHDGEGTGVMCGLSTEGATSTVITKFEVRNCVFYNIGLYSIYYFPPAGSYIDDCVIIGGGIHALSFGGLGPGGTISNCRAAGANGSGFVFSGGANGLFNTASNLVAHNVVNYGINLTTVNPLPMYNITAWRCVTGGGYIQGYFESPMDYVTVVECANYFRIYLSNLTIKNFRLNSDTKGGDSALRTNPASLQFQSALDTVMENPILGVATGVLAANQGNNYYIYNEPNDVVFINPTIAEIGNPAAGYTDFAFDSTTGTLKNAHHQRYNKNAGDHRTFSMAPTSTFAAVVTAYGEVRTDTVIFRTASPSLRMTPKTSFIKLDSARAQSGWLVPVQKNGTVTASVWVRMSTAGDLGSYSPDLVGASPDLITYNGAAPRLVLRSNAAIGITSDTVIATMSTSPDLSGVWTLVSGTTAAATDDGMMEFYVDCDGTAGWINVDDFSVDSGTVDNAMSKWFNGLPSQMLPRSRYEPGQMNNMFDGIVPWVQPNTLGTLFPFIDSADDGWLQESGGTNLYTSIDEVIADNADFIYVLPSSTAFKVCKIALSDPMGVVNQPMVVTYRYARSSSPDLSLGSPDIGESLRVRLLQGTTQIASWTHTSISATITTATQTLSASEFASITDFTDLYLEFGGALS